jgi:TPR repeat protein/serine/threonine protein kinase
MTESNGIAPAAHGQELPNGSRLQEFVIETMIGFGGFGITYLALDTSLGRKVVIKEHLPDMFSFRDVASMTVRPRHSSGETLENYEWSMGSFTRESEMLAALEHPNIVRILRRFEANGTAYFVMPFVEGQSFDKVIAERQAAGGKFDERELREVLDPLLGAFGYLHSLGIYHRDVKPGNILVTAAGTPVLIDFGAARQQFGAKSMTVIESAGYTPFEQTESRGNVGPWSDLYAFGGVLRKAITFQTPARSADRIRRDPMVGLAGDPQWRDRFSAGFLEAVDRALRVNEEDRWQRAEDWLNDLRISMVPANVGAQSENQAGTRALSVEQPPAPSVASQLVSPPSAPPPVSLATPLGSSDSLRKEMPRSVPPQAAKAPVRQLATPVVKPVRKKKSSWAVGALVVLFCAAGAGLVTWYFQREKHTAALVSTPVAPTASTTPETMSDTTPAPVAGLPMPAEWEKLADEGNAFAQALLGEGLVTGTSGFTKDVDKGLQWLAKASAEKHPLGVFLDAEQRMLKKDELRMRSGGVADIIKEKAMFREAFSLGFENDAERGGDSWSGALGRAYHGGLGTTANPVKALRWLTLAGHAGHVESQHLLGEVYETGIGVETDELSAARWYEKAAQAGWPAAQAAMARLCERGTESVRDSRKAFAWARKAADSESARGMTILGEFHELGTGVKADPGEALRWYRLAAEKGDIAAKGHLGRFYLEGKILKRDELEAFHLLKAAAEGGDTTACFALGSLYETGKGGKQSISEAIKYYKAGAESGDPAAQTALGICIERATGTGMAVNPTAAALLYEEAAAKGFAHAQFRLSMLLLSGKGVAQNKGKAEDLLEKAALNGLPEAKFEWGRCLEKGIGTTVNETAALLQFEEAAKAGISEAGFRAGLMLDDGRGRIKNDAGALQHYRSAAEAGNPNAQVNLGIMYAQGRGTTKDDEQAVAWYRKAAEQGDPDGLVMLGMMCQLGQGIPRNPKEAARCYAKAASQGDSEAKELFKKITP